MQVKNNYNECLTNLACSIQKYFGLSIKHNSIEYIDNLLNEKQPKNIIVLLFDGMGSRILDRTLDKDSFFIRNKVKEISTVFPATTTVATMSIRNTQHNAIELFPFGENKYNNLEEMLEIIEEECNKEGKRYIYAYDTEPDHTMHDFGPDDDEVRKLIKIRNNKVKQLCEKLNDSIIIIIADHGHKEVEHIYLKNYPKIMEMLDRTTSLEQRAVSFKIKKEYKKQFVKEFNKNFDKDFKLYCSQEIVRSHLFGYGDENELFRDAIGDFIAIAEDSNKCIITDGDEVLKSQHAGYSDDEIYVPLIVIDRC